MILLNWYFIFSQFSFYFNIFWILLNYLFLIKLTHLFRIELIIINHISPLSTNINKNVGHFLYYCVEIFLFFSCTVIALSTSLALEPATQHSLFLSSHQVALYMYRKKRISKGNKTYLLCRKKICHIAGTANKHACKCRIPIL